MITAKFGSKSFEVTSKKIYTPQNLSYSEELDIEEVAVAGKKPKVNIKGKKLIEASFDVKLDARFVNVENEIKAWDNLMNAGKAENLSVGKVTIGKFYLVGVSKGSIQILKTGAYATAKITLKFKEQGTVETASSSASTSKANAVKKSTSSSSSKNIKVGTYVTPKKNTRWYYTSSGAINRTGTSGKAYNKKMKVSYVYKKNGKLAALNPQGLGWMIPSDVTVN